MEVIVFIGLQAAGKSTFYRQRLFSTHVRVSLDLLRTRNREARLMQVCLETGQPFVVDNTNPAVADRARYIRKANEFGFRVVGYYFRSVVAECLARNDARANSIPAVGLLGAAGRLVRPSLQEGFQELYYVALEPKFDEGERFRVEAWNDEA